MQDFEKLSSFYLGKSYDPGRGKLTDELVLYDAKDLNTHAVIIGMTGSGKTGLGIGLLEEAAIKSTLVPGFSKARLDGASGSEETSPEFEKIFQDYWPRIFAVLNRLVGDSQEAEDLALETFLPLTILAILLQRLQKRFTYEV